MNIFCKNNQKKIYMQNQISRNRIFDGKYLTLKAILPPLNSSNTPTFLLKKHISSHQLSDF